MSYQQNHALKAVHSTASSEQLHWSVERS